MKNKHVKTTYMWKAIFVQIHDMINPFFPPAATPAQMTTNLAATELRGREDSDKKFMCTETTGVELNYCTLYHNGEKWVLGHSINNE